MSLVRTLMAVAFFSCVQIVDADPIYSWNLSRDVIKATGPNPFGDATVWSAMYDSKGVTHRQANYLPLPSFNPTIEGYPWAGWTAVDNSIPRVAVPTSTFRYVNDVSDFENRSGLPSMHPGAASAVITRWASPINGIVAVSASIHDADAGCGDGVRWFVDKENFTLVSGIVANGGTARQILQQNIPVAQGTDLYFIVAPGPDYECDTTAIDILITSR